MDWKRNTLNRLGIPSLACLFMLLTACYDTHHGSDASPNRLTGISPGAGQPSGSGSGGGNGLVPHADDDDSPADPPDDSTDTDPEPILITLHWQPNPGDVDGYIVHTGPTPETATTVITVTPVTVVEYDAESDLGLGIGDQSCFRVKAYNSEGQSGLSEAVCYTVSS